MDRNYKVYMHTNLINFKRYIGLTLQEPTKRWSTYGKNTPIGRAFYKYGRKNFKSEVLVDGLTKEEAERIEIYLIAKFCSLTTQWGYNIEKGGSARGKVSDETKEKLRRTQHERWIRDYEGMRALSSSDAVNQKRSKKLKETFNRPEVKDKLSAAMKKKWSNSEYKEKVRKHLSENSGNNKAVICDGVTYRSVSYFAKVHDIEAATVLSWLNGRHTMPDKWYEKGLCFMDGEDKRIKQSEGGDFNFTVDGIHFTRQSDLSRYLGIGDSTLSRYINGKRKCPQHLLDRGLVPITIKR